jgi:tRNA uridine 5-carboxymethylaminomethyl modification enzyme
MSNVNQYDVIVIGGGHAGCEAALASARMGARTALVTMSLASIARMPCNPSIGGIAKSHLVFELDALGGEMARNADYTGIQFRVLNTKKGPAVRANRAQCDKRAYSERMQAVVGCTPGLEAIEAMGQSIEAHHGKVSGVVLSDQRCLHGSAVVVTAGTALRGRIHIGSRSWPGGGDDSLASNELSASLASHGLKSARLKTGTPARLDPASIETDRMQPQPGEVPAPFFSWEARRNRAMFHVEHGDRRLVPWQPGTEQLPCFLTATTEKTHDIIRSNLKQSALYGGWITGTGVRYCPSVEDKVVKFADKTAHHVFIEPEGRGNALIYPNGLSNSLPEEVQREVIHSVPGLERAMIVKWAYAIEYDFFDPTQLRNTLETKNLSGLFLAGQVNGTTGYEEAAAQGFVAGVNAARYAAGGSPATVDRSEGYIGVLIDDLVTKGTNEPYRMFTSRAERRLLLRQDNARYRMAPLAKGIGIAAGEFLAETEVFRSKIESETARLGSTRSGGATLLQILRQPDVRYADLPLTETGLPEEVTSQIEIQTKYAGYIEREEREVAAGRRLDAVQIPAGFDYASISALRREAKEKLSRIRPPSLAAASRIPGITPADISVLSIIMRRRVVDA